MNDEQSTSGAQTVERPAIGRSSATDRDPNTSEEFSFWLAPQVIVNPFDIVEAEQYEDSHTYGLVLGLEHRTDAPSHLSNFISNDFGELTGEPNTLRQGTTVARAGVLSNDVDIYMPVPNERLVRFADEAGIHRALGIDEMREDRRIPAGLIEMVVDLDPPETVGPFRVQPGRSALVRLLDYPHTDPPARIWRVEREGEPVGRAFPPPEALSVIPE